MAFATVAQYEARYGTVTDTQTLQECLDDATALITAQISPRGIDYQNPSPEYADVLMRVCRQVAHRAMPDADSAPAMPFGVSQASQSAGGYSLAYSFSNPYGDIFLTGSEKKMLGIGGVGVYSIDPVIEPGVYRGGSGGRYASSF